MPINALHILGFLILTAYLLLIFTFLKGWSRLPVYSLRKHTLPAYMSIVVPVRNEAINIVKLLYALKGQHYDSRFFRVIIVDDHSTDSTREHIKIFQVKHPQMNIIFRSLPAGTTSKKQALKAGIAQAEGDAIIFMDADGLPGPHYLRVMNEYYRNLKPVMLLGPLMGCQNNNVFSRLQALEFLSLVFSTAGAAGINKPIMANGASLLVDIQVFRDHHVETLFRDQVASGDDMFLLHYVKKHYCDRPISFVKHPLAIIKTAVPQTPAAFGEQRKRWVSKSTAYRDPFLIIVALTVWTVAAVQTVSLIATLFVPALLGYTAIIWGVKLLVDTLALYRATSFSAQKKLRKFILLLALVYPFYILIASFAGWILPYQWKGREHKR